MPRRLGARLGAAFGAVLLVTLLVAAGALALLSLVRQLNVASADETNRLVRVRQWTEQVRINLERAQQVTRLEGIAGGDEAVRSRMAPVTGRLIEDMTATAKASADLQATLLAGEVPQDVRTRVLAVDQRRKEFVTLRAKLHDDLQMGEDPNKVDAQLRPAADAMVTALAELATTLERRSADATHQLEQQASLAMLLLAAGGAAAVGLGALLAWRMTRALTRPLADAAAVACGIAAGDLTQTVQVAGDDELGALLESLGTMQSQLAAMIEGIHDSTGAILRASDDIAGSSQDLDARTAEAARFLGNTSSSMASLSGSVQHSADAAASAGRMADQAAAVAQRGGEVVARVVTTMSDIQSSARRIADISSTIDGIAFQTNILALNAAVEAARAGDQGRSFAVVAGEVRSLAQRTATASREIKSLIEASVERAETGNRLVAEAGATMSEIVDSVRRVAETIEAVNTQAQHQASGIGEIGHAVSRLDEMTQGNAALVRDNGGVALTLRDQAQRLAGAVAVFQLAGQPPSALSSSGQSRM